MSAVSQLIEQRYADNTTGDITPGDAREVSHALALLAPNQRRDLLKAFRYYRAVDRDADPNGGTCLETDLDYDTCCAQTVARVEFYRTSSSENYRQQDLVCVYDGSPTPAGLAWRSGDFSDGGRLPCKFVPVQSQQAAQANVPTWAANVTYPLGYLMRYSQAGGRESFYYSLQAGYLPHPTYNQSDAYWKLVPGPVAETTLYQYLTLAEAQSIDGDTVAAGRRYGVVGKWNNAATDQLVFLDGLDLFFRRRGTLFHDNATQQEVEVNVGLGTFALVATGGGAPVSTAAPLISVSSFPYVDVLLDQPGAQLGAATGLANYAGLLAQVIDPATNAPFAAESDDLAQVQASLTAAWATNAPLLLLRTCVQPARSGLVAHARLGFTAPFFSQPQGFTPHASGFRLFGNAFALTDTEWTHPSYMSVTGSAIVNTGTATSATGSPRVAIAGANTGLLAVFEFTYNRNYNYDYIGFSAAANPSSNGSNFSMCFFIAQGSRWAACIGNTEMAVGSLSGTGYRCRLEIWDDHLVWKVDGVEVFNMPSSLTDAYLWPSFAAGNGSGISDCRIGGQVTSPR